MPVRINRKHDEIREIKFTKDVMCNSYASVLVELGKTKVLCTANISNTVPQFLEEGTSGWLTAEYNMLPGATLIRKPRVTIKPDSRSIEIQRLIGRALRMSLDLKKIINFSIIIDCDVIVADGGTRTASINGGYVALELAIRRMLAENLITENPLVSRVAAISCGIVEKEILLDLDYNEDSNAEVDFNVVMNDKFKLIELQGTAERNDFSIDELMKILEYSRSGIEKIFKEMSKVLDFQ